MKTRENVLARLEATRKLRHYKGVSTKDPAKPRQYDLVSTRVAVLFDKDDNVVDPAKGDMNSVVRTEYHGVSFEPQVWDAIASTCRVTDLVVVRGMLAVPERGEPGFYEATRASGLTYATGDLSNPVPVTWVEGTFKGGLLPKAAEIPVETNKVAIVTKVGG